MDVTDISIFQPQPSNETTNEAILTRQYRKRQCESPKASAYKGFALTRDWELHPVLCDVSSGVDKEDTPSTHHHHLVVKWVKRRRQKPKSGIKAGMMIGVKNLLCVKSWEQAIGNKRGRRCKDVLPAATTEVEAHSMERLAARWEHYTHRQRQPRKVTHPHLPLMLLYRLFNALFCICIF